MITLRRYATLGMVATVSLAALFLLTNPETLPSFVLFLVFIGIYGLSVSVAMIAVLGVYRLGSFGWSLRHVQRVVASLALLPAFLLLLRSIGQLTVRDIFLALTLSVITYLYLHRMAQKPISD